MTTKRQLLDAIQALPEEITLEEAVECLYRLYKVRRGLAHSGTSPQPEPSVQPLRSPDLKEILRMMPDVGDDSVFERVRDYGRENPEWDS